MDLLKRLESRIKDERVLKSCRNGFITTIIASFGFYSYQIMLTDNFDYSNFTVLTIGLATYFLTSSYLRYKEQNE